MTDDEALAMIHRALEAAVEGSSTDVTRETHLVADGIVDSLDVMAFLYELERARGARLGEIGEDFKDFRVARLIEMLTRAP